jgi:hypothetical protein
MSELLSPEEVVACPGCAYGYEPTSSTESDFCRIHRPKSPRLCGACDKSIYYGLYCSNECAGV